MKNLNKSLENVLVAKPKILLSLTVKIWINNIDNSTFIWNSIYCYTVLYTRFTNGDNVLKI